MSLQERLGQTPVSLGPGLTLPSLATFPPQAWLSFRFPVSPGEGGSK